MNPLKYVRPDYLHTGCMGVVSGIVKHHMPDYSLTRSMIIGGIRIALCVVLFTLANSNFWWVFWFLVVYWFTRKLMDG